MPWQESQWGFVMSQIDSGRNECKMVLVLGDVNLDRKMFKNCKYNLKSLVKTFLLSLDRFGMMQADLSNTFVSKQVEMKESALDHIYYTKKMNPALVTRNSEHFGSSDHSVILAQVALKAKKTKFQFRQITKRSYRSFDIESLKVNLQERDWSALSEAHGVNEKMEI